MTAATLETMTMNKTDYKIVDAFFNEKSAVSGNWAVFTDKSNDQYAYSTVVLYETAIIKYKHDWQDYPAFSYGKWIFSTTTKKINAIMAGFGIKVKYRDGAVVVEKNNGDAVSVTSHKDNQGQKWYNIVG